MEYPSDHLLHVVLLDGMFVSMVSWLFALLRCSYIQRESLPGTNRICTHLQGAELPEGQSFGVRQNHLAVVGVFSLVGEGRRHVQ